MNIFNPEAVSAALASTTALPLAAHQAAAQVPPWSLTRERAISGYDLGATRPPDPGVADTLRHRSLMTALRDGDAATIQEALGHIVRRGGIGPGNLELQALRTVFERVDDGAEQAQKAVTSFFNTGSDRLLRHALAQRDEQLAAAAFRMDPDLIEHTSIRDLVCVPRAARVVLAMRPNEQRLLSDHMFNTIMIAPLIDNDHPITKPDAVRDQKIRDVLARFPRRAAGMMPLLVGNPALQNHAASVRIGADRARREAARLSGLPRVSSPFSAAVINVAIAEAIVAQPLHGPGVGSITTATPMHLHSSGDLDSFEQIQF